LILNGIPMNSIENLNERQLNELVILISAASRSGILRQ
jgi:hypothetical protein